MVVKTVSTLANPLVFGSFDNAQNGLSSAAQYLLIADVDAEATEGATFTASIPVPSSVTTTGDESGTATGNLQTVASASAPAITASTASLTGFGDVAFGATSSQETFTVSADNLTAGVTVTAPTHFEISLESDGVFDSELILPQTAGNLNGEPVTIYVQFNPESAAGAVSANITLTSTGATTQNVAVSGFALDSQPTTSASGLSFTSVTSTGFTINWTRGNGDSVLVLMKANSAVDSDPADKSTYTANAAFGSGSEIGTGNRVVYEGIGTSVAVTGLTGAITYHVEVFEFNAAVASGTQNYETAGLTGSQQTSAPIATYPVIAEVYGGGGNTGAPYTHDYVVLYNPNESSYDLTGHSIQYASASGAFTNINPISGSIGAKSYFLIQLAGGATGVALPTPDLTIVATPINLSATNGKVALVSNTDGITGSADLDAIDFVGFGTANDREGTTAAAAPSNTTSLRRKSDYNTSEYAYFGNAWDANQNSTDFYVHSLSTATPPRSGARGLQISTTAGWRMMSSPVSTTYATLLGPVWTQGATGSDSPSNGAPNVFTHISGDENYTAVTDLGTTIPAGQGFIYYHFADDNYDDTPNAAPTTLTVTGTEHAVDTQFAPSHTSGVEYAIAGNPFASSIQFDNVGRAGNGQNKMWVWNPATSEYLTRSSGAGTSAGLVAPFQAFWVEYTGSGSSFTFGSGAKTTGASFLGKESVTPELSLKLSDGTRSNRVWFGLREDASVGMDALDAAKFIPLATDYLMAFSVAESKNLDLNFLPSGATETIRIPLGYETTGGTDLEWTLDANSFPTGWMVSIEDSETGTTHPVNADFSLRFAGSRSKAAPVDPLAISRNPVFKTAATAPRFTLIIDPASSTSTKDDGRGTMDEFALAQNYPNPFNPSTVVGFQLSVAGKARLSVYDVLGREVAVLVDETLSAGSHSVNFDASAFTSGVYLYKLEAGGMVLTKRMTLVK